MIKKILLGLLGFIIISAAGVYLYYRLFIFEPPAISEKDRASINLMPLPAELELDKGAFVITEDLSLEFSEYSDAMLDRAAKRFLERLSLRSGVKFSEDGASKLIVQCTSGPEANVPQLNDDESYSLRITSNQIRLTSEGPTGILRGFETLLQLLKEENDIASFPEVGITDKPRFAWRGIMIDVARHWMPKEVILRNLDAMAAVKLNVLHLHLSDDQGFRVESLKYPKLHEIGSNGKYYTQEDIKEIIDYASDRGIRIVPEFDVPGHTKSWQIAYTELSTVSYPLEFGNKGVFFPPPLDPSKEGVYLFLDELFGEMTALFPDKYFHIGGDEVNPTHWNESPAIQQFQAENNLEDAHALQTYFINRVNEIVKGHDKIMIGWEEIFHSDLSNEVMIQSWKSHKSLFEAVQAGGTGILSTGLYLDHKLSAEKHYNVDPLVLPGAVDIVPDEEHWKMYDLVIDVPGGAMEGQMVLFDRNPANAYGFFAFLDDRNAFKDATVTDGVLSFDLNLPVGNLTFEALMESDSVNGSLSLGFMKIATNGKRTGGSDMEGTEMPVIEVIKPLTVEEENRILGVEAAMWSEVVSDQTVDSRLWPRSAAIAEKAWSPAALTGDIEDMYRRLDNISAILSAEGSIHNSMYITMIHEMAGQGYKYAKVLIDQLEEVKYYDRLAYVIDSEDLYLPDLVLDHIADIARPESPEARTFNRMVDLYVESENAELKERIISQVQLWANNHELLEPYVIEGSRLLEVDSLSREFSSISNTILGIESGVRLTEEEMQQVLKKLDYIQKGDNGVLVAVEPGLRKLVINSLRTE